MRITPTGRKIAIVRHYRALRGLASRFAALPRPECWVLAVAVEFPLSIAGCELPPPAPETLEDDPPAAIAVRGRRRRLLPGAWRAARPVRQMTLADCGPIGPASWPGA